MITKKCSKCGEVKSIEYFYKIKNGKYGVSSLCKECDKERMRKYQQNHNDMFRNRMRNWRNKNRARSIIINRKSDSKNRLSRRFYNLIYQSLKRNKINTHWENLFSYNLQDLKAHLEKLFKPGMSWSNHGEWEIDHIIPTCLWSFDSPDNKEFKQCWALCNLQPLWKKENKIKGKSIDLYFTDRQEAILFGRQKLMVEVVEDGKK